MPSEYDRILVAVDGSEHSKRAAETAIALAERAHSNLTILTVIDAQTYDRDPGRANRDARLVVDEQVKLAKKRGVNVKGDVVSPSDSTIKQIIDYAKNEGADIIVVGSRGLGGFKEMLLGSVSHGITLHAPCSVLIVR